MTRGSDHEQALRLGSQFAEFCGWLYHDSGDYESAMYWTDRALEYAVELDDRRVISYVLMRKSNIATDAGQPGHGLGLANAALKQDQQLTPRLRAVALRQRANATRFARRNSRLRPGHRERFRPGNRWRSPRRNTTTRPTARRLMSRWKQALAGSSSEPRVMPSRCSRTAEPGGPPPSRYVTMPCAWPGSLRLTPRTGEPEPACTIAEELISTANGLGSARVATQVTDLRTSLAPWRKNSDVTDLLHRLEIVQGSAREAIAKVRSVNHVLPTSTTTEERDRARPGGDLAHRQLRTARPYLPLITDTVIATSICRRAGGGLPAV